MENLAKAHLTEMARAFTTALYEEEEIPKTAEEAMKIAHWRKAMLVDMKALMKSKTWEVCLKLEGVRTDVDGSLPSREDRMGQLSGIRQSW